MLLTQCRSSVGVGNPSPLNTWPRCPPQAAHVISILLPSGSGWQWNTSNLSTSYKLKLLMKILVLCKIVKKKLGVAQKQVNSHCGIWLQEDPHRRPAIHNQNWILLSTGREESHNLHICRLLQQRTCHILLFQGTWIVPKYFLVNKEANPDLEYT